MVLGTAPPTRAPMPTIRRLLLAVMLLAIGLPLPLTILVRSAPADWFRGSVYLLLTDNADAPIRPPLRPAAWWNGDFQRGFEPWFAAVMAPRGWIVRLTNQLYYSAFGRSYMLGGAIVVGREEYLYEVTYLRAYCRSTHGAGADTFASFIGKVRELQSLLARRGRPLWFMVTPSKPVIMPEFLPAGLCDRPAAPDRLRKLFVALLQDAGIPVIDGSDMALAMKARDPLPPFPRGSVHWSRLAGGRAAGALMDEITALSGVDLGGLTLRNPRWTAAPVGTDADLAAILNLLRPPLDYPTGEAESICRPTVRGQSASLIAVGGSFLITALDPIGACRLFKQMDLYFYYTLGRIRWPGGREPVDRATLRWREMLEQAAVTVIEINESVIGPDVPHLEQFLDDALAALR